MASPVLICGDINDRRHRCDGGGGTDRPWNARTNQRKQTNKSMDKQPAWLMNGKVQRLVVVVTGTDTGEALERWVFNVHNERPALHDANGRVRPGDTLQSGNTAGGGAAAAEGPPPRKSAKEIHGEIQAIVRQITASVTFLPLLDEPCAFDLLVYADKDAAVPLQWEESDPRYIQNASEVKLRGFSTKVHQVESMVAFRNGPEDEL
ncbi:unnamed protein product [Phaeothamnion confervicola]